MPFTLTEIVNDPDLAQAFTLFRSTGQYVAGGWANTVTQIPSYGVITVASEEALDMVPEGDRVSGSMHVLTAARLYETHEAGVAGKNGGLSDQIQWNGQMYRVQAVAPWKDFGFWSAVFVRMTGS
jgi:hypothetical protein